MPHIAILGAGLAGLTLAYRLRNSGHSVVLLEARERIGGRILTSRPPGGASLEMGATWLGRQHVHLTALLQELGLAIEPQASNGWAWYEPSARAPAQFIELPPDPTPSHVISRGSSALTDALARQLPPGWLRLGHHVTQLAFADEGPAAAHAAGVEISTSQGRVSVDRVVSTLPPNLFCTRVDVSPALPSTYTAFAKTCHTWMGESIKVGLAYAEPFWRKPVSTPANSPPGQSYASMLFSNAGPLTECYEHAHVAPGHYGLMGFIRSELASLPRPEREALVVAQLVRVYGPAAAAVLRYEELVWSEEAFTYAPYADFVLPHQHNGHPALREPLYGGRLLFCGSETATHSPGYMDGAVEAAERLARTLLA